MKKSPNRKRYENVAVWCNFLLFSEIFLILGVFVKGLYKILQRKFRPEKMTLFFLLFISPKGSHKKCPTDLKFVATLLKSGPCFIFVTPFGTHSVIDNDKVIFLHFLYFANFFRSGRKGLVDSAALRLQDFAVSIFSYAFCT